MKTNYEKLFEGSTRVSGSIQRLPARQNEQHGRLKIRVWNSYGVDLINWIGHEIPVWIWREINDLALLYNVSSGLELVLLNSWVQ